MVYTNTKIETKTLIQRCERNKNKIFFRVQDIMTAFKMPSLDKNLFYEKSNYERDLHYKTFNRPSIECIPQANKPKMCDLEQ
jgi:hypothetical protein